MRLSVIIITYNEESNLPHCLESLKGLNCAMFIVDSNSTDQTLDIARAYNAGIFQNKFSGYADQRNWALDNLPLSNEWVLFLDADERVSPELAQEIIQRLNLDLKDIAGFYINRRVYFMGKWIRHGGYYPTWILRLFRHKEARCNQRSVNEHFYVRGRTDYLRHDLIHEDRRNLSFWIEKHNRYASLEASELFKGQAKRGRFKKCKSANKQGDLGGESKSTKGNMVNNEETEAMGLKGAFWGSQAERKQWMRNKLWERFPPLLRPFLYFFYRYFVRLGFLDGKEGFIYHFLQGLWFPFLIDVKYLEMMHKLRED